MALADSEITSFGVRGGKGDVAYWPKADISGAQWGCFMPAQVKTSRIKVLTVSG